MLLTRVAGAASACLLTVGLAALPSAMVTPAHAQSAGGGNAAAMSFFITSVNPGTGGNLGGLAGADAYCAQLAQAAGAGGKSWRAYLSTVPANGQPAVNARDRIGSGPWQNANGVVIARSVDELHRGANNLNKQTAVNEKGGVVQGRGDSPNEHDIITGTMPDGTAAIVAGQDTTCGNWTSGDQGSAVVGHHDRMGLRDDEPSRSWNASHQSRGCSVPAFRMTGGAGLFYCFAAN